MKLAHVFFSIFLAFASSVNADTLLILKSNNGTVFFDAPLPPVGLAQPLKLSRTTSLEYVDEWHGNVFKIKELKTGDQLTVTQPSQDVVSILIESSELEKMEIARSSGKSVHLPKIVSHGFTATVQLKFGETKALGSLNGQELSITRIN